jgi:hypothetical protein
MRLFVIYIFVWLIWKSHKYNSFTYIIYNAYKQTVHISNEYVMLANTKHVVCTHWVNSISYKIHTHILCMYIYQIYSKYKVYILRNSCFNSYYKEYNICERDMYYCNNEHK